MSKAAYPWGANSCWLDSSLQIFFIAVSRNFGDFSAGFQDVPKVLGLRSLYEIFDKRRVSEEKDQEAVLSANRKRERDSFRRLLLKKKAIRSINEPESLLVIFQIITSIEKSNEIYRCGLNI